MDEEPPPPPSDPLAPQRRVARETMVKLRLEDKRLYHVLLKDRGGQFDVILTPEELSVYTSRPDCVRVREKMWHVEYSNGDQQLVDNEMLDRRLGEGDAMVVLL